MEDYSFSFSGRILKRGFWIYVWQITTAEQVVIFYVGRTGDSSSPNAQSPFVRMGQQLNPKVTAKNNSLAKLLAKDDIDPENCSFQYCAIGPIYEECQDMDAHKQIRDKVAAIESKAADWIKSQGFTVLGKHPKSSSVNQVVWLNIQSKLAKCFPSLRAV